MIEHAMRRHRQALSPEQCREILRRGTSGVLAVIGEDGWPYAVPLSYVWQEGRVLFHCALEGRKLDAIRRDGRASFCLVDRDQVVPERYTTYYRSVIVFGRARILDDPAEKRRAAEALAEKYRPGFPEAQRAEIDGAWERFCMVELSTQRITGKQARELVGQP